MQIHVSNHFQFEAKFLCDIFWFGVETKLLSCRRRGPIVVVRTCICILFGYSEFVNKWQGAMNTFVDIHIGSYQLLSKSCSFYLCNVYFFIHFLPDARLMMFLPCASLACVSKLARLQRRFSKDILTCQSHLEQLVTGVSHSFYPFIVIFIYAYELHILQGPIWCSSLPLSVL